MVRLEYFDLVCGTLAIGIPRGWLQFEEHSACVHMLKSSGNRRGNVCCHFKKDMQLRSWFGTDEVGKEGS